MSILFLLVVAVGVAAVVVIVVIAAIALILYNNNRTTESFTPFNPTESAPMSFNTPDASTADFQLTVEDVFSIKGRGVVVTGRVESGVLAKGQRVRIGMVGGPAIETTVTAIEAFHKEMDSAKAGDNVGLLLEKGIEKDQVQRGMIVTPH
jgi:translation elongation factor EF-Tu-like GTPase